jgi:hypothetical protein
MRYMRGFLAAAAVTGIACLGAGSGTAGVAGPYVVLNDHFYVRPGFTFEVVNAARNAYIGKSRWQSWSSSGATGTTTYFVNTCSPSCGEGRYDEERAQVRLFGVATCRGRAVFTSFSVVGAQGETLLSGSFRGLGYLRRC